MKNLIWGAVAAAVILLIAAPAVVTAAPSMQNTSPTPIPTLPIPPEGKGYVKAFYLGVFAGPSIQWQGIGLLEYGEEIDPIGRSSDAYWVVFSWQNNTAWTIADYIKWHPDFRISDLPVISPPPPPTATVALPPPPLGTGRVTARVLVVREGPSLGYWAIGGLPYGEIIRPLAKSEDNQWLLIDWYGQDGWIAAYFVNLASDVALGNLLTASPPPTLTLLPTETSTQTEAVPTPIPSETPAQSATAGSTTAPDPTQEPVPTQPLQPTEQVTEVQSEATPVPPTPQPEIPADSGSGPSGNLLPIFGLVAGGVVLVGAFGLQYAAGARELKRYASNGFPLMSCPICQSGELHLEETVRQPLGIPRIKRSVHCDACRSVLRQMRPGVWRYTIDPHANATLAEKHNGLAFTDRELPAFAGRARAHMPSVLEESPSPSEGFQDAVEHLQALEATVIALQEEALQDPEEEHPPAEDLGEAPAEDLDDQQSGLS